jgi:hypothetical protein
MDRGNHRRHVQEIRKSAEYERRRRRHVPAGRHKPASASDAATASRFVQLSSERTLEPVRQDRYLAEKQESHPALLVVVGDDRPRCPAGDDLLQPEAVPVFRAAAVQMSVQLRKDVFAEESYLID